MSITHRGLTLNVPSLARQSSGEYYYDDAISISPVVGAEALTNGDFSAWTGDDPDSWSLSGESAPDPEVTERDSGQLHADTKSAGGAANFYQTATVNQPRMLQNMGVAADNFTPFQLSAVISARASGTLGLADATFAYNTLRVTSTGTHTWTMIPRSATLGMNPISTNCNMTLDSISAKPITNYWQLFTHEQPYGKFSINYSRVGSFGQPQYQAGIVFNYADATHYGIVFDAGEGKVRMAYRNGGFMAFVNQWNNTYVDDKTLTLVRHQDGTLDVLYNGATLASGLTATGLSGVQAGPMLTDASNVSINWYEWDPRGVT